MGSPVRTNKKKMVIGIEKEVHRPSCHSELDGSYDQTKSLTTLELSHKKFSTFLWKHYRQRHHQKGLFSQTHVSPATLFHFRHLSLPCTFFVPSQGISVFSPFPLIPFLLFLGLHWHRIFFFWASMLFPLPSPQSPTNNFLDFPSTVCRKLFLHVFFG